MKVADFTESQTGGDTKKVNPFDTGLPSMNSHDFYLFSMFRMVGSIEKSIAEMREVNDYRPYLLVKLLCSSVVDIGERTKLLNELSKVYNQVLAESQMRNEDLSYPEKKAKQDFFWWRLTASILPIVGSVHSYLDRSLNITTQNVVAEC